MIFIVFFFQRINIKIKELRKIEWNGNINDNFEELPRNRWFFEILIDFHSKNFKEKCWKLKKINGNFNESTYTPKNWQKLKWNFKGSLKSRKNQWKSLQKLIDWLILLIVHWMNWKHQQKDRIFSRNVGKPWEKTNRINEKSIKIPKFYPETFDSSELSIKFMSFSFKIKRTLKNKEFTITLNTKIPLNRFWWLHW